MERRYLVQISFVVISFILFMALVMTSLDLNLAFILVLVLPIHLLVNRYTTPRNQRVGLRWIPAFLVLSGLGLILSLIFNMEVFIALGDEYLAIWWMSESAVQNADGVEWNSGFNQLAPNFVVHAILFLLVGIGAIRALDQQGRWSRWDRLRLSLPAVFSYLHLQLLLIWNPLSGTIQNENLDPIPVTPGFYMEILVRWVGLVALVVVILVEIHIRAIGRAAAEPPPPLADLEEGQGQERVRVFQS